MILGSSLTLGIAGNLFFNQKNSKSSIFKQTIVNHTINCCLQVSAVTGVVVIARNIFPVVSHPNFRRKTQRKFNNIVTWINQMSSKSIINSYYFTNNYLSQLYTKYSHNLLMKAISIGSMIIVLFAWKFHTNFDRWRWIGIIIANRILQTYQNITQSSNEFI